MQRRTLLKALAGLPLASLYPRLLQVKQRYDPGGLFFVHHGVGT